MLLPGDLSGPKACLGLGGCIPEYVGAVDRARIPGIKSPFHIRLAVAHGQSISSVKILNFTLKKKKGGGNNLGPAYAPPPRAVCFSAYEHAL